MIQKTLLISLETEAIRDTLLATGQVRLLGKKIKTRYSSLPLPKGWIAIQVVDGDYTETTLINILGNPNFGIEELKPRGKCNGMVFDTKIYKCLEIVDYDIEGLFSVSFDIGMLEEDIVKAKKSYNRYLKVADKEEIPLSKDSKLDLLQDLVLWQVNNRITKRRNRSEFFNKIIDRIQGIKKKNYRTPKEIATLRVAFIMSLILWGGIRYGCYLWFWPFDLQSYTTIGSILLCIVLSYRFTGDLGTGHKSS